MKTTVFQSFLATFLRQFVQYKRALNRKYDTDTEILRLLDRYIHNRRIMEWQTIDGTVIADFLKSRPRVSPCSFNQLLGVLRRFFNFAIMQEWIQCSPVTASPRRITGTRIPYLFDLNTAQRLLAVARSLPETPRTRHRGLVYETVFAVLYGLGLRVGEVARLKLADADLTENTLLIRDTKFSKTRIVPLGPNLAQRLKRYIEQRHGISPDPELSLFSYTKRGSMSTTGISMTFHALVPRLELHIPQGVSSPRLHDLRHSFAVATLLRWYREGIDPNCRLMSLSTFLGHVDPASTAVYLTITEDLLHEAALRFHAMAPKGGLQ
jgi:site-specific recombinase XerD